MSYKNILIWTATLCFAVILSSCQKEINIPVEQIPFTIPDNSHPLSDDFQEIIDEYRRKGLVGISAVVEDPTDGFWSGASGVSSIESGLPMSKFNLHRSGSIPKMYTGTAIMLLAEQDLIDLGAPIDQYLPENIISNITNGDKITVTQLLNHSSGVYDYTENAQFYFDQLNDAANLDYTPLELIEFIYNKSAQFDPGKATYYSNSNYLLLAVIIDFVAGESHAQFFKDRLFDPLGLNETYYKIQEGYPNPPGIVNAYADWNANDKLINISDIYSYWEIMVGDDGMVASTYDFMRFTKSLFEGEIVSQNSLNKMMEWRDFEENDGLVTRTGLGIQYWQSTDGEIWGMGHRGATHGTGGYTFYFPVNSITVTVFTNTGCERGIYGDLLDSLFNELAMTAAG